VDRASENNHGIASYFRDLAADGSRLAVAVFCVAILSGLGAAIFLFGLEWVTATRVADPRWFWFAPVAGLITGLIFLWVNPLAGHGNILLVALVRRAHERGRLKPVPGILSPLIVFLTWVSHLGGLSVGREGTAVQMGGGIAALSGRIFGVKTDVSARLLLHVGLSCGFGAVFGVPWAGASFALEVSHAAFVWGPRHERSVSSRLPLGATVFTFALCFLMAGLSDQVARAFGAGHAHYPAYRLADVFSFKGFVAVVAAAIAFGGMAWLFLYGLHVFKKSWAKGVTREWLRPLLGGCVVAPLAFAPGNVLRYAGLGAREIAGVFVDAPAVWDWFAKLVFTVFSIGVGFKGGEVTPLFFMGASSGAALAGLFQLPLPALASLGLVAVFGAAADVPFACAIMAAELFGPAILPVAVPVCFIASWVCRHARLYDAKPEL